MAYPLTSRFGSNAVLDDSTPTDPKLIISLGDLQTSPDGDLTAKGLDDVSVINSTNIDTYVDKIFQALFKLSYQNQPAENNSETVGFYVERLFKNFVTRNNVTQVQDSYQASFYGADKEGELDADDIV